MQGVVALVQCAVVDELAEFLNLSNYEVLYLRQHLATTHCLNAQEKDAEYFIIEVKLFIE